MPADKKQKRKFRAGMSSRGSAVFLVTMLLISIPVFGFVKSRPPLSPFSTHGIGQKAVAFKLADSKGLTHSLDSHKDQGLFLYFFTLSLSSSAGDLEKIEKVYAKNKPTRGEGFEFLGICVGCSDDRIRNFVKESKLTFPILADQKKTVAKAYGLSVLPVSLVISNWRTVKFEHLGPIADMEQTFFGTFEKYLGIRLGIWRFRHGTDQEQEAFKKQLTPAQQLKVFDVNDPQISELAKTVPCICNRDEMLNQCGCDRDYKTAMYRWINFFLQDGSFSTKQIEQILQWKYEGILRAEVGNENSKTKSPEGTK